MLEGVLANMLRHVETFYMLEGVLANMSARWRPFTCWWEC